MQIIAQAPGTPDAYQAITLTVNQPTTVQIKIDKYVALGSLLIPASSLITIIIILVAIILFALVEVYRRRRAKHAALQPEFHPLLEKSLYGIQRT